METQSALEIVRLTDVGKKRGHNEDAISSDSVHGLVVLADGMGGYKAGEVASEIAVLSITAELTEAIEHNQPPHHRAESTLIQAAVKNANETIYQVSQTQAQCAGMGTTLVMALFVNNQVLVGHIGDSRMYRFRLGALEQITEDHSLLQEQVKLGLITVEQAMHSEHKNLVTRALGVDPEVELELHTHDVVTGDIYLLCSDGLSDMVADVDIASIIEMNFGDLEKTAKRLVQTANDNGGKDNISVILVKVLNSFEQNTSWVKSLMTWLK